MKTILSIAAATVALAAVTPAQAAIVLSAVAGTDPYSGPTPTFNFDAATPQYSGPIYTTSTANIRAQPFGSTGGYIAAGPTPNSNGTTLDLTSFGDIVTISFLWGSVDRYNTLDVLSALAGPGNVLASFTGSSFSPPTVPNGCQNCSNSNVLATLTLTGADRSLANYLRFTSSSQAFEVDNVTVNAVPEPATWGMMILGFGLIGAGIRRRREAVTAKVSFI